MSCCCTNKYPFCNMIACKDDGINLSPIVADIEGEYILELNFLGGKLQLTKTFEVDEEIIFPSHDLNENFEFEGKLIGPDGETVTFSLVEDGPVYDCFSFTLKTVYNLSA